MQFILGNMPLSAPTPHPSAFLSLMLTSLSASPLLLTECVCLLCCLFSSGAVFADASLPMVKLRLNSCKGHMRTQIDAHRGPEDNTQPGNHKQCLFCSFSCAAHDAALLHVIWTSNDTIKLTIKPTDINKTK